MATTESAPDLSAMPLPQQLLHWARTRPNDVALRQKHLGIWQPVTCGSLCRGLTTLRARLAESGHEARRRPRHPERELPRMDIRRTRRGDGACHHSRHLSDVAGFRGGLPAGALGSAGGGLRRPGAARQGAGRSRPVTGAARHRRDRPRAACATTRETACTTLTMSLQPAVPATRPTGLLQTAPAPGPALDDIGLMVFTSGSTGRPQGAR